MANWEQPSQLSGSGLILSPLRPEDGAAFRAALGPPEVACEVLEHLSYGPPDGDLEATRLIEQAMTDPDRWPFAQRLSTTGEFVGTTSFYELRPDVRALAIGHTWIARPYWRTSVNTASKLIMMEHAFDTLGAERVVWHTDVRNTRSQAAIARLGASREGVLRHHRIRRDGSWRDTMQYSLLASEWPPARERLRARLAEITGSQRGVEA